MTLISFLIVCPLTFLAGLVDSIAGGGGLISLPAFLFAGLPMHTAIATNKLSSSVGTTVSTARYCKNGFFDRKIALPSIVLALTGSAIGARLVLLVEDIYLRWLLIAVLPVVAVLVFLDKGDGNADPAFPASRRMAIACIAAFVIGMYDGFYGPGTGTFLLLALTKCAHMDEPVIQHCGAGNLPVQRGGPYCTRSGRCGLLPCRTLHGLRSGHEKRE